MDPRAFDELSKRLAEKTSRGRALKLFGGALVGTFVGAGAAKAHPPQKHCKFARYSCQRNIDCCSNNCCNRICCDDGMTCCGGECLRCPVGQTVDPNTCECVGGSPPPPPPPGGCTSPSQCPEADPGSCQAAACVAGQCTFVDDPNNVPQCGECSTGTCIGGQPACVPDPPGTPCSNGVCDGTGQCVPVSGCGNNICEPGESITNCSTDCPAGVCPAGGDFCVGTAGGCSPTNGNCICLVDTEGMTVCVDATGVQCGLPACASSTQCPGGERCVVIGGPSCCGVSGPTFCLPLCTS